MRIALGVEYNGSDFSGWQMQNHNTRTVQSVLETALSRVADQSINVTCAGRTDTGVHATGQVVHFDVTVQRPEKAWVLGVNAHLPDDVSSLWACEVDESFSARFTATARQYRYVILNRRGRPALFNRQLTWRHGKINVDDMHQAAQVLLGEQDFSSFRSSACQAEHARRCIHFVNVSRQGDYIYIDIEANAFLHHMVRNIVGSLLMIGQGEQAVNWMAELMQQKDRTLAGPTAPADGLYLVKVSYPEQYKLPDYKSVPVFA
ncbi:MAG: tRNA pseudouridine(38-40) synthase TruA [Gammaproteobacteria bacterium]|nr:tRNA pseudouridine(38-40) synthase TruA [Gammaproteobacteria bacterium]